MDYWSTGKTNQQKNIQAGGWAWIFKKGVEKWI